MTPRPSLAPHQPALASRCGTSEPSPGQAGRTPAAAAVWEGFARQHGRSVTRSVARAVSRAGFVARADELEELVQEVYCRLLEQRDVAAVAGRPDGQLWCYLQRIAYSVVVDHLRARSARKRGGAAAPGAAERGLDDRPSPEPSPEERLLVRERAHDLQRRVRNAYPGRLGERNLRVLELAAVEGMTANEIAARLRGEIAPSSVHTVLHRLRRLLAAEPPGDGPGHSRTPAAGGG